MLELNAPLSENVVRSLNAGDMVRLSGRVITARDAAHKWIVEENPPNEISVKLRDGIIFHCGPIVKGEVGSYTIVAAGPTTSMRHEPYEWRLIQDYGIKAIIGKGGMGRKTIDACMQFGCVYFQAIGGAASLIAKSITKVHGVHKLEEFGMPEAMWELEIRDFPLVVAIDTHEGNIYSRIKENSENEMRKLFS